MTRVAFTVVLSIVAVATIAGQPIFSSRVEGVRVDVLVTDASRRPLRGLTKEDFVIRDNGVQQEIDLISFGEASLNVGLAFDMSESVAGGRLDQLRAAGRALASELQSSDRALLVTFDQRVSMPCRFASENTCILRALNDATPNGPTALIDGVFAAMTIGESDVGRSLLMIFSDGVDTASWLTAERVLDIARRSDVVVYAVAAEPRSDFLDDVASLTGGRVLEARRNSDLSVAFRSILDEFRYRYLVTYTPKGVPRAGWHKLDVRVKRPGAAIRARPGYQG
jgi:Ca-activated chloride channel family protein